jgi:hypothetical protein
VFYLQLDQVASTKRKRGNEECANILSFVFPACIAADAKQHQTLFFSKRSTQQFPGLEIDQNNCSVHNEM